MKLSEQIKSAIRQSGQSIYRVSLAVQVEEKSLRRFMRGEKGLSMSNMDKLAAYLGLAVSNSNGGQG